MAKKESSSRARRVLVVDIGNTRYKATLMVGQRAAELHSGEAAELVTDLDGILAQSDADGVALCRSGADKAGILFDVCRERGIDFLALTASTPVPLQMSYPRSQLGADRLAGAVGVDGRAVLLADAGTALTLDLVRDGRYEGGDISAGIEMRLRALHEHTAALPEVNADGPLPVLGKDTDTAMRAGAVRGMAMEIAATYASLRKTDPDLRLVLTGGDAPRLEPLLKEAGIPLITDRDTVARGMVKIYEYNRQFR